MSDTTDFKKMMADLDITGLKEVHAEVELMLRSRAMQALELHQIRENELRELAGLKRRPVKAVKLSTPVKQRKSKAAQPSA